MGSVSDQGKIRSLKPRVTLYTTRISTQNLLLCQKSAFMWKIYEKIYRVIKKSLYTSRLKYKKLANYSILNIFNYLPW